MVCLTIFYRFLLISMFVQHQSESNISTKTEMKVSKYRNESICSKNDFGTTSFVTSWLLERTDIVECPFSYPLPFEGSIFWISSKTAIFILIPKKKTLLLVCFVHDQFDALSKRVTNYIKM
jgi:hypothetical protein